MKDHEIAQKILFDEYTKIAGKVFAEFFIRINANDEQKKSLEATDFMIALMTGKGIRQEWKLEETEDYKKLQNIVHSINKLTNDQN